MEKPEALDYLYNKVIRSRLAHKLAKFIFLIFLHGAKMNEKFLISMMGVGASFFQESQTSDGIASFRDMFQQLQKLDDKQLEEIADKLAKDAIEDRGYYRVLFMPGLLKL